MKLEKKLSLFDIIALASGAMISSGLFVLPGIAFAEVGPAVLLSYLIACLLILPAVFVQAELATAMPRAGGTYVFIERSLGPLFGTFAGFLNWLSIALKAAFALIGLGAIAEQFFPDISVKAVAVAGCVLFTLVNLVSVKSAGRMQVALVVGLLGILLVFVVAGLGEVQGASFVPFITTNTHSIFAVAGLVFVSFGGLTKVASLGEEAVKPSRDLPLGMFAAWLLVSLLYLLVIFVVVGTVAPETLAGSLVPVGLSARAILGDWGMVAIDLAAGLAFITTANAGILSASRTPLAMSRDGLVPEWLSKTSERYGTPYTGILLTSASIILVIVLLSIEDLVKTASTMMILLFMFLNFSLITLRLTKFQSYQPPFRCPWVPWLPILISLVYAFLIIEMGIVPLVITFMFGLVAVFYYIAYVRPRIERESAFVHLVRSVTSKPLQRLELEDELRQISLERVAPELSQFFETLEKCPVLELEGELQASEMYRHIAEKLDKETKLNAEKAHSLLLEREYESSTIMHPGVSIPMLVVDQIEKNTVLLVRSKAGVQFSPVHPPVHAIIVLLGPLSERNFHLRALMRLAHIIEEKNFLDRWLAANDENQLRDVLLVRSRVR